MKLFFKSVLTTAFSLALGQSAIAGPAAGQASATPDCTMAPHLAGHALTMLKGGASLNQTLGMFDQTTATQNIIKEVFAHKDEIKTTDAAAELGKKVCLNSSVHG